MVQNWHRNSTSYETLLCCIEYLGADFGPRPRWLVTRKCGTFHATCQWKLHMVCSEGHFCTSSQSTIS